MKYEIVERSSGYWIVNSLESGVADHPIFDLQPYMELDEAVEALEAFENLKEEKHETN